MSRRFVSDHADRYSVSRLCAHVGVARSTFYEWRGRGPSQRDLDDAVLADEITVIWEASHRTYGAPRVYGQLAHHGWRVGRKRVARLMVDVGLVGVHGRFQVAAEAAPTLHPPPTYSRGISPLRSRTTSGWLISPSSPVGTGNCSWPGSKTSTTSRSWAGRWAAAKQLTWSSTHW